MPAEAAVSLRQAARGRRAPGRMKLLVLCVLVHGLSAERILTIGRWKEQLVAPDFLLNDQQEIPDRNSLYGVKRSFRPVGFAEQVKRFPNVKDVSLQSRPGTSSMCNCETQFEVRDLGEGYYPRYLSTAHCKPKAYQQAYQSKFNSCRLLHYMVYVLSQRDFSTLHDSSYTNDSALPETLLPEALRHEWQLKPMSITVACVPATDRRN